LLRRDFPLIVALANMSQRNFFAELKRRNVYKVAAAYAVVAWLLVQAASIVLPAFEAPGWVMKVVLVLVVLGCVPVLIFAWAFELTPEGIKRESEIERGEAVSYRTGRKLVAVMAIVALVAASLLLFQLFHSSSTHKAEAGNHSSPLTQKSIAVLPFDNLSSDKENSYFVEGIQDEILTRLAKIADLKVISRSSTQSYKSAPDNLREIGIQLGVAHVLEGSVQRIGNNVLINVQLIRAADNVHVWAESYNRKLDDVFAVEGEVAATIAEQLNARLTGSEQSAIAEKPTSNAAAYEAYLRGLAIENRGVTDDSAPQAASEFAAAVRRDPQYAQAWAHLAVIRSYLYFNGIDPAVNSAASVKEAADRARSLRPDSGEAWLAQAVYLYRVVRDFQGALASYREALKRLPNSSFVLTEMAHLERRAGEREMAEKHYRAAVQLDPRNIETAVTLGEMLSDSLRFEEAQQIFDKLLAFAPDNEDVLTSEAFNFLAQGRLRDSAAVLARIKPDSESSYAAAAWQQQLAFERRFEEIIARAKTHRPAAWADDPRTITMLGYWEEFAGRTEESQQTFRRAIAAIQPTAGSPVPLDARRLPAYLALAYAGLHEKQKALDEIQRAIDATKDDALDQAVLPVVRAAIQARFGDADAAIATLSPRVNVPDGVSRAELRLWPLWDPLRSDPRFQKLSQEPTH
jgi:TolB-like protein/cytochrome c-type biogenesis protein CcmH/NrfG